MRLVAWPALGTAVLAATQLSAAGPSRADAARAAIHPVDTETAMRTWLARVPRTADYPPDFDATLRGQGSAFIVEMSSAPACLPCGDLWNKLQKITSRYGLGVRTISEQEAMLRSGRLGLPWIGHPVAWMRPIGDPSRIIPVAIGTDHEGNITRNLYLAAKMQAGVRPAVGVRAMAKFTGIVGVFPRTANPTRQKS